jgi:Uri superfamily endonuclease
MEKGTYALVMSLKSEVAIVVGRLVMKGKTCAGSEITFPPGYYVYFGSAHGGLSARVIRHLKHEKRLHWHIDYLTRFAKIVEVWYALESSEWKDRGEKLECLWCQVAQGMPHGQLHFPGFGSSDCRCTAHLIHFPSPPSFELFRRLLKERGNVAQTASPLDFERPIEIEC